MTSMDELDIKRLLPKGGNALKVVKMGLENRILESMKSPKFSVRIIAEELRKEGFDISENNIRSFVSKSRNAQRELIGKDLAALEQFKKITIDYTKAIQDILKEVQMVKDEVKETKDFQSYNQLVGRLMQGIELMAKLSGDLTPKVQNIDMKIIYNEINSSVDREFNYVKKKIFGDAVIDVDAEIIKEDTKAEEEVKQGEG